jgi:hypothetical protein
MRVQRVAVFGLVMIVALCSAMRLDIAAAADGDQCVGTWKGSW